jgi:hypothetical protein
MTGEQALAGVDIGALRTAIAALQLEIEPPVFAPDGNADLSLLRLLYAVGRVDLPLGRLFEGHVDAQQIIGRYGSPTLRCEAASLARRGATFGVWNADLAGEPLRLGNGELTGGRAFASGAGVLSHALVTADAEDGRRLILVDLAATAPEIDRSWWRVVGMQRSETHLVRWAGATIDPSALVGAPGDYAREPWFSGGALRFVAVHAGGVAGIFDRVRDHLVGAGRADDPHQAGRLADLFGCADLAAAAVRTAAAIWSVGPDPVRLAQVAAARLQVAGLAESAMSIAQQAVGLQGLFLAHPLLAALTDLTVYLRQPGPDAQRMRVGRAVSEGRLEPAL